MYSAKGAFVWGGFFVKVAQLYFLLIKCKTELLAPGILDGTVRFMCDVLGFRLWR